MKTLHKMLTLTLALMLTLTACGMAFAEQEARKIETPADADEWIQMLFGEHPEELDSAWELVPEVKTALDAAGGMKAVAMQITSIGEIKEIQPAYQKEIQGFQFFYIPCVFSTMSVDIVLVTQNGAVAGIQTGVFSGKQESASSDLASVELNLPVPSLGELPGILTLPEGDGSFPAIVLVHGSGPNDMDETIFSVKPFKDLAEGLAAKGVAVYRYDKRTYTYGKELADNYQLTLMEETVDDAAAAVQMLAQQEKIDPERIYVLGHSLGGIAIPMIDKVLKEQPVAACGYVMMAGSPRKLDELFREQYEFMFSVQAEAMEQAGMNKEDIFSELDRLNDLDALADSDAIQGAYAPYWKWLAEYDQLKMAEDITKPVLVLQGEEDWQVTMKDFGIWQEAFGDKDNWTLISYPGLIHSMTHGVMNDVSMNYMRAEKVDEKVISDIAAFILEEKK
ncbi:alpha/beta fold hydrolase [Clostridiales bacterium FE2011]|nr:alpha/beta fold hydrolase [Clostridiales bacterium FE2011]